MIEQSKVREGESILQEYKNGKTALEKRVIANEQWYKSAERTRDHRQPPHGCLIP